jgi:hypothetical protein
MRVCIVVEPNFGARLSDLDYSLPIWVVQSRGNDSFVSELWSAKIGNVTRFQPQPFAQLLDTVDQHHPGWSELEVHGSDAESVKFTLADYGSGDYTETIDGFVFRRFFF